MRVNKSQLGHKTGALPPHCTQQNPHNLFSPTSRFISDISNILQFGLLSTRKMGESISPTTPAVEAAATDPPSPPPQLPAIPTEAPAESSNALAAEGEDATPPPRLIDSDPSKFRSLKQVIVIGLPGSGIDGKADALRNSPYLADFQCRCRRCAEEAWLQSVRFPSRKRSI